MSTDTRRQSTDTRRQSITVRFEPETVERMEWLAQKLGLTRTGAIHLAIAKLAESEGLRSTPARRSKDASAVA